MPDIRYYTVTQEREVKVQANSPIDAAMIANAEFTGHPIREEVEGALIKPIRDRDLIIREDY